MNARHGHRWGASWVYVLFREMLVAQEPVRLQEYLKTDYAQAFPVPNRGRPLAMLGDLKVRRGTVDVGYGAYLGERDW